MKLVRVVILCLYFVVSFQQFANADDETAATEPTPSPAESASTAAASEDVTTASESAESASTTDSTTEASSTAAETTVNAATAASESESESSSAEPSTELPTTEEPLPEMNNTELINKLSSQILSIIQHFQQPNPIGLPGQTILPDPLPAPNVSEGLGVLGKSEFYNMTVQGLSNFTVDSVNALLDQKEVYVKIRIVNVLILGNCTLSNMFFSTQGPFNLTLTNVTAEGVVTLIVKPDGALRANHSVTTMSYQELNFHLGANNTSSLLSSVVNAAGLTVISAIQPYIQSNIDERLTNEVNKQLRLSPKFPAISNTSPVDLAILAGRKYVAEKYEPYVIQNIVNHDTEFLTLNIGPVTLHGLSKFTRVGDISLGMVNRTLVIKLRMITGPLLGICKFYFNFGKVPALTGRRGEVKFSTKHLQFEAIVHQPVNLKQKPRLDDLQLEMGPVHVQFDKQGSFDYFVELTVRKLPELIRHLLIDTLEEPIKRKIQDDILEKINVDELVTTNLPHIKQLLLHQYVNNITNSGD